MGLDTTHDCWHGSYSSFTHWRHAIAEAAGYAVLPVTYPDGMKMDCIMLDWGHLSTPRHLIGKWGKVPADPLVILFAHSDCDGEIVSGHCQLLADALEPVIPKLPDDDLKQKTDRFVKGLRLAAKKNENVKFS